MTVRQIEGTRNDMVHYAALDLAPEELESRGLNLEDSWIDGLGPIKRASVLLPSGVELALVWHEYAPRESALVVMAPLAIDGSEIAHELTDELNLSRARITWLREDGTDMSHLSSPGQPSQP
jgi:hypothetical protein